jgi:hypothetical protein
MTPSTDSLSTGAPAGLSRAQQALSVLWSAFLAAGVLEMIVFALVDPATLRWVDGGPLDLEARAVYTLAFFVFWAVIALGAGLALLLCSGTTAGERSQSPDPRVG